MTSDPAPALARAPAEARKTTPNGVTISQRRHAIRGGVRQSFGVMGEWERERTDGMGQPGWDAEWERVNREALAAVADWRAAHPTATLREIEVAVDAHLAAARARLLEAVA